MLLGSPIEYGSGREILKEIRSLVPGYANFGPDPTPPRPDAAVVQRYLERGYADDLGQRYALTEGTRPETGSPLGGRDKGKDQLQLVVGQTLFHSGKFSTRAKGLLNIQASGFLALNPADAGRRGIEDGAPVRILNELGEARTVAKLFDRLPEGVAFFPEHFDQEVRRLLSVTVDPKTQVPYWRQTWVTVEKGQG